MSQKNDADIQKAVIPPRKSGWKIALAGFFIFLCGIAVGTGGTVLLVRSAVMKSITHPQKAIERAGKRLKKKLNLRQEQVEQAQHILTTRMINLMEIRLKAREEVARQLYLFHDELTPILDETQAHTFEKMFKRICRTFPEPLEIKPTSESGLN